MQRRPAVKGLARHLSNETGGPYMASKRPKSKGIVVLLQRLRFRGSKACTQLTNQTNSRDWNYPLLLEIKYSKIGLVQLNELKRPKKTKRVRFVTCNRTDRYCKRRCSAPLCSSSRPIALQSSTGPSMRGNQNQLMEQPLEGYWASLLAALWGHHWPALRRLPQRSAD